MAELPIPGDRSDATTTDDRDARPLTAVVVRSDDGPDECTVSPFDAADEELVTTWISAAEGSFVALDEMR